MKLFSSEMLRAILSVAAPFFLLSCGGGGGGSDNGDSPENVAPTTRTVRAISATTNGSGLATVTFTVSAAENGAQVVAQVPSDDIQLLSITGPNGASLFASTERADGTERKPFVSAFSFPTVGTTLAAGQYRAQYQVSRRNGRENVSDATVSVSVITKSDPDLSSGTIPVNLITVGAVSDDTETQNAIDEAISILDQIFERANLTLNIQRYSFSGGDEVPDPRVGSAFYGGVTAATRAQAVNLVLGVRVRGANGRNETRYSLAGSTPGVGVASPRSVAAISIRDVTGGDGRFDDDGANSVQLGDNEKRTLAEEMARHIGRFLGLQSPVDIDGSRVVETDRLGDTASCVTLDACESNEHPKDNFMFPRSVLIPGEGQKFFARQLITAEQAAAMQRSVFVD